MNCGEYKSASQQGFSDAMCDFRNYGKKSNTDVLGKIRAEIEQNAYPIVHGVNNHEKGMTLYGILQIIDKYKVESKEYNRK